MALEALQEEDPEAVEVGVVVADAVVAAGVSRGRLSWTGSPLNRAFQGCLAYNFLTCHSTGI